MSNSWNGLYKNCRSKKFERPTTYVTPYVSFLSVRMVVTSIGYQKRTSESTPRRW